MVKYLTFRNLLRKERKKKELVKIRTVIKANRTLQVSPKVINKKKYYYLNSISNFKNSGFLLHYKNYT